MFEVDRGAVFSHTQSTDDRFDDLFSLDDSADMQAFQFGLVSDPVLLALRDPNDPMHQTLVNDPFYTVPIATKAQKKGKKVFEKFCMSCHNTPNVFNALDNVEALGPDQAVRTRDFPAFGPPVGRTYNIGVAEQNKPGLPFADLKPDGSLETIVIQLYTLKGQIKNVPITQDLGLAASTGRFEDIGRFKVPQLRDVKSNGPYFHNNSAITLEEVIEYKNSQAYNKSKDGKKFKIKMNKKQRENLLEFLKIL